MTTPVFLRKALPADLGCLQAFEQGIVAAERPMDPRLRDEDVRYYDLEAMLSDDSVEVVLAISGSTPIGCGLARLDKTKDRLRHREEAYLGLMFVEPSFRGRGINQQILAHLMQWCRAKGVSELVLDVYANNAPALSAYEKAGFSNCLVEMRMTLPNLR